MNLCIACREVTADSPSGLVRATCELAEALATDGHSVHLLTDRWPIPPPTLQGVSIERLHVPVASGPFRDAAPESARHNLMHAAAVYREVVRIHEQEEPVDAVLAPLWRSEGAVCVLDERFPTIVSCMTSLKTLTQLDDAYRAVDDIAERLALEGAALKRCRYLHGLTTAALEKTIADYGLAPATTAVIGRGLQDRVTGASNGSDPSDVARILFVGRVEPRKGIDTLLAAVAMLLEEQIGVQLTVAGPVADPRIVATLGANGTARLAEATRFTGPVTDDELVRLYASSDLVCLPSRYESHGVALLEAMMFGKALATCAAGGIGEVVEPGHNALLTEPDNAPALATSLRRLVLDPDLRERLGTNARETYERRFDSRSVARMMAAFVTDVAAAHHGNGTAIGDVGGRLASLLCEVLAIDSHTATELSAELLDPAACAVARRLHATARRHPPGSPVDPSSVRVSAVIVTHDRPEQLGRALDSLSASATPATTIVIDNGSQPAAADRVAAACEGRERLVLERSNRNLRCAGGRRLATTLAETELVLFLDDDAELMPGALDHLVAELDRHPGTEAVAATVVTSDGVVSHSGGRFRREGATVNFSLCQSGSEFDLDALPASGPTDWVPGTAVLVRRALLEAFPLDDGMAAYFEDNEWCYRVSRARPGCFRRSREALALHTFSASRPLTAGMAALAHRVDLLGAIARFHERHGLLLAPALFETVPELRAEDGTYDLAAARVLLELVSAKGERWILKGWREGALTGLLDAHRRRVQIDRQLEPLAYLQERHETLCRIEQGGWWRLRGRMLPLIRFAGAIRRLSGRAD